MNARIYVRGYRFSFQSQESDDEIRGKGNSLNYKFRMHDPRIGRFFAVDPLAAKYPYYTPYSFSGNTVIYSIELEGLEPLKVTDKNKQEQVKGKVKGNIPDDVVATGNNDWNSQSPSVRDVIQYPIALNIQLAGGIVGHDNAAGMLDNYLSNSGEVVVADIDYLMSNCDNFSDDIIGSIRNNETQIRDLVLNMASVDKGNEFVVETINKTRFPQGDLHYALGSAKYKVVTQGIVTKISKESSSDIRYRIEITSEIFFWDRYDWNPGEEATFNLGINVKDDNMRRLHTSGISREYGIVGYSKIEGAHINVKK